MKVRAVYINTDRMAEQERQTDRQTSIPPFVLR